MSLAKKLPARPRESIRRRVLRVPFCNDVVISHILQTVPDGNEVRRLGIACADFAMDRIEQTIGSEFRMEDEADEATFQSSVDSEREGCRYVRVKMGLIVGVEQI